MFDMASHVDLRQLRYFLAIAEAGTISGAATRLHVAQPALSLHLRNMEERLGTTLFTRSTRGVTLTEAGRLLAQRARIILDEFDRMEDDIRNLGRDPHGEVRLGLPSTIGGILAVPLALSVTESFPNIRLAIAEAMSGFVLGWLEQGRVDVAILYARAPAESFRSELLLKEELVLIAQPGTALPGAASFDTLSRHELVLPSSEHGLRRQLDRVAARADIRLRATTELDSYANMIRLVEAGAAVRSCPCTRCTRRSRRAG
jgi:LysR family transcriptional regulator, nitrogen assimilation regulatory protein